jgi:DNA-binding IclR family transcriptional regulator
VDSTLAKGLGVLDWLARQGGGARLGEVAQALGLGRSNAHRTLQTLVQCGWARQNPDDSRYFASLKLFELGALVDGAVDLKDQLHPFLAALAQATGETIHLVVLQGPDIVYLDKFDSRLPVAAYSRIGGRAPAHCAASGKALLAALALDDSALRAQLGASGDALPAHTPHTLTTLQALQADLAAARTRGWASNAQEWRLGVCGLGATVFNARGEAVAAVGMSVPAIRCSPAQAAALAQPLCACAAQASTSLGLPASACADRPGSVAIARPTARPTNPQVGGTRPRPAINCPSPVPLPSQP